MNSSGRKKSSPHTALFSVRGKRITKASLARGGYSFATAKTATGKRITGRELQKQLNKILPEEKQNSGEAYRKYRLSLYNEDVSARLLDKLDALQKKYPGIVERISSIYLDAQGSENKRYIRNAVFEMKNLFMDAGMIYDEIPEQWFRGIS